MVAEYTRPPLVIVPSPSAKGAPRGTPDVWIKLTRGQETRIDSDMLALISSYSWCANLAGTTVGGKDAFYAATWVRGADGKRHSMYLHRFIMRPPPGFEVDHINRDTLDNRKINMRVVPRWYNNLNRSLSARNTSGRHGVSRSGGRWRALISVACQDRLHLGYFDTVDEASAVYEEAARRAIAAYDETGDDLAAVAAVEAFRARYVNVR